MTSAWTRKDGSFTICKRDGSPDEVKLEIDDPGPCEAVPIEGTFPWGTHGLRIELPRALSVELTVVEAGTGTPVEDFSVRCQPTGRLPLFSQLDQLRLGTEPHRDGKVVVDRIWRGPNVLTVMPRDQTLLPSEPMPFDAVPGQLRPIRVELVRLQAIEVRLVDADGKAIAASKAWIVDDTNAGRHDLRAGMFTDIRGSRRVMSSDPTPMPSVHSSGTVRLDAELVAVLRRCPDGRLQTPEDLRRSALGSGRGATLVNTVTNCPTRHRSRRAPQAALAAEGQRRSLGGGE